jgi:hypothetical protein
MRAMFAAVGLLAILMLVAWALVAPTWRVRTLRVSGTSDPRLVAAIHDLPLLGCDAFRCDTARDVRLIERLPAVARADVAVVYPSTLVVRVTPRVPVLIWRVAGHDYLVGADGVLIAQVNTAPAAGANALSVVDDPRGAALAGAPARPGARLAPSLVGVAAQLLRDLPDLLGRSVALGYDADAGLVADDGQGLRVAFGDPARPPADTPGGVAGQVSELRAILAVLNQRGLQAEWIDLRWGLHPSYRLVGT